ncbi:MAG TPA: hypothetical protein VFV87_02755 [Pirellulaceae bacterium]|nr:hypothetical protein [Pirellulaceae bacterium]
MIDARKSVRQGREVPSNLIIWIVIALGIGGCMYWQNQAHRRYLETTSPEQQAIDRDEMVRHDAFDDERFP